MNKNLYRIVFNKARGMLMVVADIAASGRGVSSPSSGIGHTQSRRISTLSTVSLSLLLALGCVSLPAQAGIVADGSAQGNQQPTIISSANGTPQVNIQTPSSGGVSRNVYSQFDVDNRGVILNNGHSVNQTELGGLVDGNPWLAQSEASIILNEVNSSDPSKLNGYIEVAGRKAHVVIANPAGITCEGCGFINAHRATLTTGQAQLNNGQLTGYNVERGEIVVQGSGMDNSRQDHTDLIARSVKVNAGIWANELNVTAGRNQVDAAHQNINAKTADGRPRSGVAMDVANLGGMYAGKIRLIGTESGVGVYNAGEIGASAGDITIAADGMLMNSGQINSNQQLAVNTTAGIENAGVLYAQGNTQLTTAGKLSNSGIVAAAGDTSLRATEVNSSHNSVLGAGVKADNSIITSGTLRVDASGTLTAQGKNISGTAQTLNARSIDLSGSQTQSRDLTFTAQGGAIEFTGANLSASHRLSASTASALRTDNARLIAEQVTLDAEALSNVGGLIAQTGTTDFNLDLPGYVDNRDGTLQSAGKLSLHAERLNSNGNSLLGAGVQRDGKLAQSGDLHVTMRQALIAQGQTVTAGAMTLSGSRLELNNSLTQAKDMRLTATEGDIVLTGASVIAANTLFADTGQTLRSDKANLTADQINLTAHYLSNVGGQIVQKGSSDFILTPPGYLDNRGGAVLAKGNVTVQAERLTSNGNSLLGAGIQADGSKAGSGNLQVNTTQELIAQGQNVASGAMALTGSGVDLSGSQTQANTVAITARDSDISTQESTVLTPGTLTITAAADPEQMLNNRGGKLHADNIQLNLAKLDNNKGEIAAATDMGIRLQSDFTHQTGARLTAGRDLVFNSSGALINQHKLEAGRDMQLSARSISNANTDGSSALLAGRDLSLSSDCLFNSGAIYATGVGQLTVNGDAENRGKIYTEQQLALTTIGNLANSGVIQTRGNMRSSIQGDLNNSGAVYTQAALQWQTDERVHNSGSIAALGDLQLRANDLLSDNNSLLAAGLKDDGSRSDSGNLTVSTEQILMARGETIAVGAVTLSGSQLDLTGSQTQANAITLVAKSGDITLTEAVVKATTQLSASTTALLRTDNAHLIAEQVTLSAQAHSNVGGLIAQTGTTDFNLNLPGYVDNHDGTFLSTGHIEVQAERLDSDSGSLLAAGVQSDGRLTDTGDLAVATRQGLIAQGRTFAAGAMTLTGSRVDLTGSQTQAREMNVIANSGDVSTPRANILSLGSLTISAGANAGQTLNNQGGTLAANNISLNLGQFDSSAGKIMANQDLTIDLQSDFSNQTGSTLQTGRDLTFTTSGALANEGQLLAGGKFNTDSSSLLNNGKISAAQADLRTAGALNNSGEILTSDILTTYSNTLFNSGTMISVAATLKARVRITNSGPKALIGATDENGTLTLLAPVIENSDTVTHTDTAPTTTILGMGNVILAGGKDSRGNYQTAAQVLNLSSLTESGKDLLVYANTLTNSRHILTANTNFVTVNTVNGSAYWTAGNPDIPGGRYAEPPHGGSMNSDYIGTNYTSTLAYNSIDKISPEAQLLIGGNFTPQVGTLENYWSKVNAQGEINLSGVTLQQDGWGPEVRERTTNQYASSITAKTISDSGTIIHNGANPGAIAPPSERDSTGKNIAVEFNGISLKLSGSGLYQLNTDKGHPAQGSKGSLSVEHLNASSSIDATVNGAAAQTPGVSLTPSQVGLRPVNTTGGQYDPHPQETLSFAHINPPSSVDSHGQHREPAQPDTINTAVLALHYRAVSGGYLVETHPAFANLNHWRGSDYVLQQLNSDPATMHKRLGDNLYEQRLVRDQVLALTGQAVASDYRSAQEQYEQLFAAGLEYSKAFNIALGTNLSAEQMAVLTRNIVLMETREVVGQPVLVPVVYLARCSGSQNQDTCIAPFH